MANRVRKASHAGSWYTANRQQLSNQLDGWLAQVPDDIECIGPQHQGTGIEIPPTGARAIIAPHAGYAYSGPAAAWAYKSLDLSNAKRIFLLGPSHHFYLSGCALSTCTQYETPLGNLRLDLETISELRQNGEFEDMTLNDDEEEHSLEMHLPYIYKMLSKSFSDPASFPTLIPILVGSTQLPTETEFGALLAPYLADPSSIFIISSDFAHWGTRFQYTYYRQTPNSDFFVNLGGRSRLTPNVRRIHESIKEVDFECMGAVERGNRTDFWEVLERTRNTVCGRHPIGVYMAAVEALRGKGLEDGDGRMRFVRYERSELVEQLSDSSVSYASGFAVFKS
ncbi:MAG: hypothetical protein M1820_003783 [Bogoriella megaspora]|nr:MAG: hypothetical protein M1820_003783 [Bogoriella megaspora]